VTSYGGMLIRAISESCSLTADRDWKQDRNVGHALIHIACRQSSTVHPPPQTGETFHDDLPRQNSIARILAELVDQLDGLLLANRIIRIDGIDQLVGSIAFIKVAPHELLAAGVNRPVADPPLQPVPRFATVRGCRLHEGTKRDSHS